MIKEAYVSFEIARLLKEKNFNEACEHQYYVIDKKLGTYNTTDRSRNPERYIDAPTHQMVMAWLRKKGWHITIDCIDVTETGLVFTIKIVDMKSFFEYKIGYDSTYEKAVESALKYCFEKVI